MSWQHPDKGTNERETVSRRISKEDQLTGQVATETLQQRDGEHPERVLRSSYALRTQG